MLWGHARENLKQTLHICHRWKDQKFYTLCGLIRQFENPQEHRILGILLDGSSHVKRTLRVQITISSTTYLYFIIHIGVRLFEFLPIHSFKD